METCPQPPQPRTSTRRPLPIARVAATPPPPTTTRAGSPMSPSPSRRPSPPSPVPPPRLRFTAAARMRGYPGWRLLLLPSVLLPEAVVRVRAMAPRRLGLWHRDRGRPLVPHQAAVAPGGRPPGRGRASCCDPRRTRGGHASCARLVLTEIYLRNACPCQAELTRTESPRQADRALEPLPAGRCTRQRRADLGDPQQRSRPAALPRHLRSHPMGQDGIAKM
jgi:hypothetical protein